MKNWEFMTLLSVGCFLAVTGAAYLAQFLWFAWRRWRRSKEPAKRMMGVKLYLEKDDNEKKS